MGFNLQMKRIFYGGFKLASGRSPRIYNVIACFFDFCSLVASNIYFYVRHFYSIYRCSIASNLSVYLMGEGLLGTVIFYISSKGSSSTWVCRILTFIWGLLFLSTLVSLIFFRTSIPSYTFPKMVCLPAKEVKLAFVKVIKN